MNVPQTSRALRNIHTLAFLPSTLLCCIAVVQDWAMSAVYLQDPQVARRGIDVAKLREATSNVNTRPTQVLIWIKCGLTRSTSCSRWPLVAVAMIMTATSHSVHVLVLVCGR